MTHADAVVAMLSGGNQINAHFTSPPFHQREIKDPRVRTRAQHRRRSWTARRRSRCCRRPRSSARQNPAVYGAVLAALDEANELIRSDPKTAAEILFAAESAAGFSVDELVEVLRDPEIRFTTTPENTREIRRVHARDRLDRASAGLVARPVLSGDSRQPRDRKRLPSRAYDAGATLDPSLALGARRDARGSRARRACAARTRARLRSDLAEGPAETTGSSAASRGSPSTATRTSGSTTAPTTSRTSSCTPSSMRRSRSAACARRR